MAIGDRPPRRVKTADTVFGIIEMLHELDGASLAELSEELNFAKSTIHDHLSTLVAKEYVVKSDGKYSLSLKFLYHGVFVRNNMPFSHAGRPIIEELAERTGEIAWLIVEEHGRVVYLDKAMGERGIQTHAEVGGRGYLHTLASGKILLAHMTDERADQILDRHGLPKQTSNTITDRNELEAELEQIRDDGFAINDEETVMGVRAISAPVLDEDGIVGAICVSGPANRVTETRCHEEIKPLLMEATNELELKLQYPTN